MDIPIDEIGLSKSIKTNLDIVKERIARQDIDWVHLNVGTPGSGKSTLGHWMCMYMDPNYSVQNIAWSFREFCKLLKELPPKSAICPDEAVEMFSAKESMGKETKKACKLLIKYRFKNFFYCLNTKNFWNIDKDTRGDSIRTMCHCWKQGYTKVYISRQFSRFSRNDYGIIKYGKPMFYGTYNKMEGHSNDTIRKFWEEYYKLKEDWADRLNKIKDDEEEVEEKPETIAEIAARLGCTMGKAYKVYTEKKVQHIRPDISLMTSEKQKISPL